jgi:hypothetical protein
MYRGEYKLEVELDAQASGVESEVLCGITSVRHSK